jgi:hypothetical protein
VQQPETRRWTATSHPPRERGRAYDPWAHAEELGLQVLERPIRTGNELWLPRVHTLVIKQGMRVVHKRNALAHGIAHAELGHDDDRPKHEQQADRYAANNLILLDEFRDVMKWAADFEQLTAELGVTRRLAHAFLQQHQSAV